jgi:hypothetical protein
MHAAARTAPDVDRSPDGPSARHRQAGAPSPHCGGLSMWSVGGRMGQVMGEDAVEGSPAATDCVQDCQAQNQIRGRAVVRGLPFPGPVASRLTPRQG